MDKDKNDEWNSAIVLLLKLLSHESDGVKQLAYEHLKVRISYTVTHVVCEHYHATQESMRKLCFVPYFALQVTSEIHASCAYHSVLVCYTPTHRTIY